MRLKTTGIFLLIAVTLNLSFNMTAYAADTALEPNLDAVRVATCGASTYVIKSDRSLWFFGVADEFNDEIYTTPVKVMDNVKKITLGNMSTTYGAYMPTCMVLTYDNDLYMGGSCRYCPQELSEAGTLTQPKKVWEDVRDMGTPSGYGEYTIIENDGDAHIFSMGENVMVINVGDKTYNEYLASKEPDHYSWRQEQIRKYWWDFGNMAEEAVSSGFHAVIKKDGSVWTAVNVSEEDNWYHGYVLGNGTELIRSDGRSVYIEPTQILPPGTCAQNISVVIDGKPLEFDVPPITINDRTMVPVRAIFEALGADINWNGNERTISAKTKTTSVKITIDSPVMYVNNNEIQLDAAACIIDSRTLVPARAVAASFGANVGWDENTQTVIINTK